MRSEAEIRADVALMSSICPGYDWSRIVGRLADDAPDLLAEIVRLRAKLNERKRLPEDAVLAALQQRAELNVRSRPWRKVLWLISVVRTLTEERDAALAAVSGRGKSTE